MKETFLGNHYFDEEVEKRLMEGATIIFDTNALLNFYRYTKKNRDKFFEILNHKDIKNRLYMPYQVGYEFYKNMESRKYETGNIQKNLQTAYEQKFIEIKDVVLELQDIITDKKYKNLIKERGETIDNFIQIIHGFDDNIETLAKNLKDEIKKIEITRIPKDTKEILNKINEIFKDKVGERLKIQDEENFIKEAKRRKVADIPPGYKDESNGDFIIWKEMMSYAKDKKIDIFFVSNDVKEDWVHKVNGYIHGARKELLEEFKKETEGQVFSICTSEKFFELFEKYYKGSKLDGLREETKILDTPKDRTFRNLFYIDKKDYEEYKNNFLKLSLKNNIKKDILATQIRFLLSRIEELQADDLVRKGELYEKIVVLEEIISIIDKEEEKSNKKYFEQVRENIEEIINPTEKIAKVLKEMPIEKQKELLEKIEGITEMEKLLSRFKNKK